LFVLLVPPGKKERFGLVD